MSVAVVRKKSTSPERPDAFPGEGERDPRAAAAGGRRVPGPQPGEPSSPGPEPAAQRGRSGAHARNWSGPVGAQISAVAFGFFGLTCLLMPFFLLVAGWRRLRRRGARRRWWGAGSARPCCWSSAPALLQIGLGRIVWSDGSVAAGGAFGVLLADLLQSRLNLAGTLVVLVSAVGLRHGPGGAVDAGRPARRLAGPRAPALAELDAGPRAPPRAAGEGAEPAAGDHQAPPAGGRGEAEEDAAAGSGGAPAVDGRRRGVGGRAAAGPPGPAACAPAGDREEGRGGVRGPPGRRDAGDAWRRDEDFPSDAAPPPPASCRSGRAAAPGQPKPAPQKELPFVGEIAPGTLPPVNLLQMADGRTARTRPSWCGWASRSAPAAPSSASRGRSRRSARAR